jgi:exosortase
LRYAIIGGPLLFAAAGCLSVATQVSTAGLVMLGQPALSEGNTIWLGEHQIFVEEACSGLRIFIGIFALAFAFVLFSRWAWWQKAVALVTALPIAIVANATRIIVTGLLFELASGDAAKKFMHDFSGVAMIPFAAVLFWAFYIYLDRLFPTVELYSPVGRMAADTDS